MSSFADSNRGWRERPAKLASRRTSAEVQVCTDPGNASPGEEPVAWISWRFGCAVFRVDAHYHNKIEKSMRQPTFSSRVAYKELRSAIEWLEKAFGFTTTTLATGADGKAVYAEMAFGNGVIQIGTEWENIKAPGSLSGANTQTITAHWRRGLTNTANEHVRLAAKYSRSPQINSTGIAPIGLWTPKVMCGRSPRSCERSRSRRWKPPFPE